MNYQGNSRPRANRWVPRPYDRNRDWRQYDAPSGRNYERRSDSYRPSSRYQPSRSASPPDSNVGTKTLESRRDSRIDLQQPSWGAPAALPASQPHQVVPGIIMFVPNDLKVKDASPSRLLRQQPWVNDRATGHPVAVWDTYEHGGELIARCLPLTSFTETRVEDKYVSRAWKHWLEYVPIKHQGVAVASDANMPSLALADGESMSKLTYVHLDHFFDIEARFLDLSSRNTRYGMHLEDAALSVLVFKFHQFISGEIKRPSAKVVSPLDSYDDKAPVEELARPKLNHPAEQARVNVGRELEAARHRAAGTREWTGKEPLGPHQQAQQDLRARM